MVRVAEPVFTRVLDGLGDLRPATGSVYVTGISVEERSQHTARWETMCDGVTFARLVKEDGSTAVFDVSDGNRAVR